MRVWPGPRFFQELLRKIFLDLTPLRPAVLPADLQRDLNDLRGFRHVFRHGYGIDLDIERLQRLVTRWRDASPNVQRALSLLSTGRDSVPPRSRPWCVSA